MIVRDQISTKKEIRVIVDDTGRVASATPFSCMLPATVYRSHRLENESKWRAGELVWLGFIQLYLECCKGRMERQQRLVHRNNFFSFFFFSFFLSFHSLCLFIVFHFHWLSLSFHFIIIIECCKLSLWTV